MPLDRWRKHVHVATCSPQGCHAESSNTGHRRILRRCWINDVSRMFYIRSKSDTSGMRVSFFFCGCCLVVGWYMLCLSAEATLRSRLKNLKIFLTIFGKWNWLINIVDIWFTLKKWALMYFRKKHVFLGIRIDNLTVY